MSAQKSYSSKHSEYRTYSTKGNINEGDFSTALQTELLPSNYGHLVKPSNGVAPGNKEFFYEYREERNPIGSYDRKDLHTVEQYNFLNTATNQYDSSYDAPVTPRPAITSGRSHNTAAITNTSSSVNRDLSHNIEELDTLLDDLQRDQERKQYKGGYASDTMDTSSFDYRSMSSSTPTRPYNTTISRERETEWLPPAPASAQPTTIARQKNQEIIRNITETHSTQNPAPVCVNCQSHSQLTNSGVSGTPMNKVTTTVKTYTYEVPADRDPTTLPIPDMSVPEKRLYDVTTTERRLVDNRDLNAIEQRSYVNSHTSNTVNTIGDHQPSPGPHYNSSAPGTPLNDRDSTGTRIIRSTHYSSSSKPTPPPVSNTTYKYSSSDYSTVNRNDGPGQGGWPYNSASPGAFPTGPSPSPGPFPRTESPAPRLQEPPKRLDDLLADFPGHENYPPDNDASRRRPNPARGPGGAVNGYAAQQSANGVSQVDSSSHTANQVALTPSRNIAGPAVYYPPGHEMFAKKDESMAYQQAGGGGHMKASGKYKYEAEASSKSKSSTSTKAVPVCLPLCCAMPCVLL